MGGERGFGVRDVESKVQGAYLHISTGSSDVDWFSFSFSTVALRFLTGAEVDGELSDRV